jgi:hypothetical protein
MSALLLAIALAAAPITMPDSVYVTENGTHYHATCHADACYHVARLDAEAAGFLPCKLCFSAKAKKDRPFDRLRAK